MGWPAESRTEWVFIDPRGFLLLDSLNLCQTKPEKPEVFSLVTCKCWGVESRHVKKNKNKKKVSHVFPSNLHFESKTSTVFLTYTSPPGGQVMYVFA